MRLVGCTRVEPGAPGIWFTTLSFGKGPSLFLRSGQNASPKGRIGSPRNIILSLVILAASSVGAAQDYRQVSCNDEPNFTNVFNILANQEFTTERKILDNKDTTIIYFFIDQVIETTIERIKMTAEPQVAQKFKDNRGRTGQMNVRKAKFENCVVEHPLDETAGKASIRRIKIDKNWASAATPAPKADGKADNVIAPMNHDGMMIEYSVEPKGGIEYLRLIAVAVCRRGDVCTRLGIPVGETKPSAFDDSSKYNIKNLVADDQFVNEVWTALRTQEPALRIATRYQKARAGGRTPRRIQLHYPKDNVIGADEKVREVLVDHDYSDPKLNNLIVPREGLKIEYDYHEAQSGGKPSWEIRSFIICRTQSACDRYGIKY